MNTVRTLGPVLFLGCLMPLNAGAKEPTPRVLMMDLKATLVDEKVVGLVQNMVSTELAQQKGFELITGAEIRQMVALEGEKQAIGCADNSSCLSELAGAMGARYVFFGEMGKLGSFYLLTLSLFDSKMAKSAARDTLKVKSIDELVVRLPLLIKVLMNKTRAREGLSGADKKVDKKKTVFMRDAFLEKGRLKGYAYDHPKFGEGPLKSSKVVGITYDERGTASVETQNTVYVVGLTGWAVRPDEHPLNRPSSTVEKANLEKKPKKNQ